MLGPASVPLLSWSYRWSYRSPSKSICTAVRELELPLTTVHKVLHIRLRLYAYKVQMLPRLQPNDKPK